MRVSVLTRRGADIVTCPPRPVLAVANGVPALKSRGCNHNAALKARSRQPSRKSRGREVRR